jgi:hypothetical protein
MGERRFRPQKPTQPRRSPIRQSRVGPGSYEPASSIGKQQSSRQKSSGAASFGKATREQQERVYSSPQHAALQSSTVSKDSAYLAASSALGKQASSKQRSSPRCRFGTASRFGNQKQLISKDHSAPGICMFSFFFFVAKTILQEWIHLGPSTLVTRRSAVQSHALEPSGNPYGRMQIQALIILVQVLMRSILLSGGRSDLVPEQLQWLNSVPPHGSRRSSAICQALSRKTTGKTRQDLALTTHRWIYLRNPPPLRSAVTTQVSPPPKNLLSLGKQGRKQNT